MKKFLFETPFSTLWMTAFRIGTGLILFGCFICLLPEYDDLFGANRLADARLFALQNPPEIGLTTDLIHQPWIPYSYPILCLILAAGYLVRPAAVLLLVLQYSMFTGSYAALSYGYDYIASSCLFYCLIFPVGLHHPPKENTFWLRWLQLHVCLIYLFAGCDKLVGPTWRNGEALWKAVTQPGFESIFKPDLTDLAAYPWLWVGGGWAVFLLEVSYPLFIWLRPTRRYWLWGMVSLHLGIALFMGLYFFSALMILLNLVAFYYPYLSASANQIPISIPPMVSPLSPNAQGLENPDAGSGLIQNSKE